jgi:CheY-like chemotaxis protein
MNEQKKSGQFKILLVDDDAVVHMLFGEYMGSLGHQFIGLENGTQCIDQITTIKPDILFLDVIMPDLSGFEVLQRLQSIHLAYALPVVLLTANPATEATAEAYDVRPDAYLTKPFDLDSLKEKLQLIKRGPK